MNLLHAFLSYLDEGFGRDFFATMLCFALAAIPVFAVVNIVRLISKKPKITFEKSMIIVVGIWTAAVFIFVLYMIFAGWGHALVRVFRHLFG